MKTLAIVPARGRSKRIPHKNLAELGGLPLLHYTCHAATHANAVDAVCVSSDDDTVLLYAVTMGCVAIRRPDSLCGDHTQLEDVAINAVSQHGDGFQRFVILQPTSPLRGPRQIDRALAKMDDSTVDAVVSVCELVHYPWSARIGLDGEHLPDYEYLNRPRTQDVEKRYAENGAIYAFRPWLLFEHHCRLGGTVKAYPMDRVRSVDIDEPEDLQLAEWLLPLV